MVEKAKNEYVQQMRLSELDGLEKFGYGLMGYAAINEGFIEVC